MVTNKSDIPEPEWIDQVTKEKIDAGMVIRNQNWHYSFKPLLDRIQSDFGLDLIGAMLYVICDNTQNIRHTYQALYELQKEYQPVLKRAIEHMDREMGDEDWKKGE